MMFDRARVNLREADVAMAFYGMLGVPRFAVRVKN